MIQIMIQMFIPDCFGFSKPRNDDKGEGYAKSQPAANPIRSQ